MISLIYGTAQGMINDKKMQNYWWKQSYNVLPDTILYNGTKYEKAESITNPDLTMRVMGIQSTYKVAN